MRSMKSGKPDGKQSVSLDYIIARCADLRPSEARREILRTLKHRGWWEASVLIAHYVTDVDQSGSVEQGIRELGRTTGLNRASVHRYLAAGRLVVRRLAITNRHPIPTELSSRPMPMAVYSEAIRASRHLRMDPLDMMLVLERDSPTLTVAQIRSRTKSAKVWADATSAAIDPEEVPSWMREVFTLRENGKGTTSWAKKVGVDFKWGFISTDGIYRAASGSMERIIGCNWRDITAGANVTIDGEEMPCRDAWYYMMRNAASDHASLPMHMAWPDIKMENLVLVISLGNLVSGLLFVDFDDPDRMREIKSNSFRQIRESVAEICTQLERDFPGQVVPREELQRKFAPPTTMGLGLLPFLNQKIQEGQPDRSKPEPVIVPPKARVA